MSFRYGRNRIKSTVKADQSNEDGGINYTNSLLGKIASQVIKKMYLDQVRNGCRGRGCQVCTEMFRTDGDEHRLVADTS